MTNLIKNPLVFSSLIKLILIIGFINWNQWWIRIENYYVRIIGVIFLIILYSFGTLTALIIWSWKYLEIPGHRINIDFSKFQKSAIVVGFSGWIILHMIFTAMDINWTTDTLLNEPIFVSSFHTAGDPLVDSIWLRMISYYNMIYGSILDFVIFWMIWKGKSWRSTVILSWVLICPTMIVMTVVGFKCWSTGNIHPLSAWMIWAYPIWLAAGIPSVWFIPRDFTLTTVPDSKNSSKKSFKWSTFINYLIGVGQIGSLIILIGKIIAHVCPSSADCTPLAQWIVETDPGLFLNNESFPWSNSMIYYFVVFGLVAPAFAICSIYNFCYTWSKPPWLWDISFVAAGQLFGELTVRILQELYYKTPTEYKGYMNSFNFWLINGFSFIVALAQLSSLYKIKKHYVSISSAHESSEHNRKGS